MIYAKRLAYSMHLAWKDESGEWVPFHHNEGILYAKAVQKEDGTLIAKSLRNPWMFAKPDGGYGVAAVRTEAEGEADEEAEGCILLFPVTIWCIGRSRACFGCNRADRLRKCGAVIKSRRKATGCYGKMGMTAGGRAIAAHCPEKG